MFGFCGSTDFANGSVPREKFFEVMDGMVGSAREDV
jgi:hypothetical protein